MNKINPFESSGKSPGIDKKENQFFQKLEKKFGFATENNEGEEHQDKNNDSNNYENNNESEMLENLQTPENEKTTLLSSTGSRKLLKCSIASKNKILN